MWNCQELSPRRERRAQAREQIRELVGEIRLVPTADGYLEAVLTWCYEGVLKLAVGAKLNNFVAGAELRSISTQKTLRIALR